jgi:uncharacterized protein YuzE
MPREQLIQNTKEKGLMIGKGQDFHITYSSPQKILGVHIFNESNAIVYARLHDGFIVIYVKQQKAGGEKHE